mmetsp:Transcript_50540/g.96536  ORF Transcript_50540/g.96536 Transcript_50540/m.96536 type:complete len:284 (-) Transcript_50540:331-1182(-)
MRPEGSCATCSTNSQSGLASAGPPCPGGKLRSAVANASHKCTSTNGSSCVPYPMRCTVCGLDSTSHSAARHPSANTTALCERSRRASASSSVPATCWCILDHVSWETHIMNLSTLAASVATLSSGCARVLAKLVSICVMVCTGRSLQSTRRLRVSRTEASGRLLGLAGQRMVQIARIPLLDSVSSSAPTSASRVSSAGPLQGKISRSTSSCLVVGSLAASAISSTVARSAYAPSDALCRCVTQSCNLADRSLRLRLAMGRSKAPRRPSPFGLFRVPADTDWNL